MVKLNKAEGWHTACLPGLDADALDVAILVENVLNLLQRKTGLAGSQRVQNNSTSCTQGMCWLARALYCSWTGL